MLYVSRVAVEVDPNAESVDAATSSYTYLFVLTRKGLDREIGTGKRRLTYDETRARIQQQTGLNKAPLCNFGHSCPH